MDFSPENKRTYQADVYFSLATVIQAIILTGLGNEIIQFVKNPTIEDLVWVGITSTQSLLICVSFWFHFVRDYFFGFRIIILNAKDHFVLALTFFSTGLMQYIAFHFLNDPRKWLTFILISIGIVFLNSIYISTSVIVLDETEIKKVIDESHGSKFTLLLFIILIIILLVWYVISNERNLFFRLVSLLSSAGLITFFIFDALKIFNKQLEIK